MAKINKKINEYRLDGARWILDYAKENGLEKAENELRRRGVYKTIPLEIPIELINEFENESRDRITNTILLMSCCVLRDEYDFGKQRIERFISRFNEKIDAICDDYVSWKDLADNMQEELGIKFLLGGGK